MEAEARLRLQKRVGIVLAAAPFFFAAMNAATFVFVFHRQAIDIIESPFVCALFAITLLAVPTIFLEQEIFRIVQAGLFLSSGVVTVYLNQPGNLAGIVFYIFGLLLAIQFGYLQRQTYLKIASVFAVVVAAAVATSIRHHSQPVTTAIITTAATACFLYLYWSVSAEEIIHYRIESERLRQEAISNQVFLRFGQNVAGIIHNVKSMLMSIEGFNDLISDSRVRAGEPAADYLALQKRGIEQMHGMIDGLLMAVRSYQRTKRERLSLGQVVDSAVEMLRANRAVRSGVKIRLNLTADDEIYAAPLAVIQVLDGLIQNAWESMTRSAAHEIDVETRLDGAYVACCVRDKGSGLPFCTPCEVNDCLLCPHFEIGRSTKRQGSGIGVVHARTLIREMGGKLKYESVVGEGTTVCVWFPRQLDHTGD